MNPTHEEAGLLVEKQLGTIPGAPNGYLQYLPKSYTKSGSDTYPCIIYLHGSGEGGNGTTELYKVRTGGGTIPRLLFEGWNGESDGTEILHLAPQRPASANSWQGSTGNAGMAFAQWVILQYRIDLSKVYLTGFSMGGKGTWNSAGSVENTPNIFAAIAPVSTAGAVYNDGVGVGNKNIPCRPYHADNDTVAPINNNGTTPWNGYLSTSPTADHPSGIQIMTGAGHNPTRAYAPNNTYFTPNMYQWFLTQSKS